MTKLMWSELEKRLFEFGRDFMGEESAAVDPRIPGRPVFNSRYWFARAATIYAGTSEIQRNIIAERVLGLPKG